MWNQSLDEFTKFYFGENTLTPQSIFSGNDLYDMDCHLLPQHYFVMDKHGYSVNRVVWTDSIHQDTLRLLSEIFRQPLTSKDVSSNKINAARIKKGQTVMTVSSLPEWTKARVQNYYARDYALLNALRTASGLSTFMDGVTAGIDATPITADTRGSAKTWYGKTVAQVCTAFRNMSWSKDATNVEIVSSFRNPPLIVDT